MDRLDPARQLELARICYHSRTTVEAPREAVRPKLIHWLLDAFKTHELRMVLEDWPAARGILDAIGENSSRECFVRDVLAAIERRNLLTVEFFAQLAAVRPLRVTSLLPLVAATNPAMPTMAQLRVVKRAVQVAVRSGATRELLFHFIDLAATVPELAPALAGLTHDLQRGTADAYMREIGDAVANEDIETAFRLLITYLGEHHGRQIAREQVESLRDIDSEQRPSRILESAAHYRRLDQGSGPPPSETLATRLELIRGGPARTDVVFACDGFHKTRRFAKRIAFQLKCPGLELRCGQLVGVVGVNGGGKTTLLQILAGRVAEDPDPDDRKPGARLRYPRLDPDGAVRGRPDWHCIQTQIYFVPQRLEPWRETVAHELSVHAVRCGLRGKDNDNAVKTVCGGLGLDQFLHYSWRQMSGGNQLKLELAKALLSPAEFIVLDEPLATLDINAQQVFLEHLRNIASSQHNPRIVLLSSQHVWEVEQTAHRILYIDHTHDGDVVRARVFEGPSSDGACFEISGDITEAYETALNRFGEIVWIHYRRRSCLFEPAGDPSGLWHTLLDTAEACGATIDNIRDVSRSRLQDLRKCHTP